MLLPIFFFLILFTPFIISLISCISFAAKLFSSKFISLIHGNIFFLNTSAFLISLLFKRIVSIFYSFFEKSLKELIFSILLNDKSITFRFGDLKFFKGVISLIILLFKLIILAFLNLISLNN